MHIRYTSICVHNCYCCKVISLLVWFIYILAAGVGMLRKKDGKICQMAFSIARPRQTNTDLSSMLQFTDVGNCFRRLTYLWASFDWLTHVNKVHKSLYVSQVANLLIFYCLYDDILLFIQKPLGYSKNDGYVFLTCEGFPVFLMWAGYHSWCVCPWHLKEHRSY